MLEMNLLPSSSWLHVPEDDTIKVKCLEKSTKFSQASKLQQLKCNSPSASVTTGSVAFLERYFSWTILSRPHFLTVPFNSLQWGQTVTFLALSKICLWRAFRTKYGNPGFITFIFSNFLSLSERRTREHVCKDNEHLLKFMVCHHNFIWLQLPVTSHQVVYITQLLAQSEVVSSLWSNLQLLQILLQQCMLSYYVRDLTLKKTRLTLKLGNQQWEGRDRRL